MADQSLFDLLESTRLAFLKLEHCCFDCDEAAVLYLRQRALTRLADLEAEFAILQNQALFETDGTARHPSFAELETLEEDARNVPAPKLD
jgi:hypothetical protein